MNEKDNNNEAKEPINTYEVIKPELNEEEFHPVLKQLLEKSLQEANEGKLISHEEVMRRVREKYPFLK